MQFDGNSNRNKTWKYDKLIILKYYYIASVIITEVEEALTM